MLQVLPAVCTEERMVLGALLTDGTIIVGQNEISHPSLPGVVILACRPHCMLRTSLLCYLHTSDIRFAQTDPKT